MCQFQLTYTINIVKFMVDLSFRGEVFLGKMEAKIKSISGEVLGLLEPFQKDDTSIQVIGQNGATYFSVRGMTETDTVEIYKLDLEKGVATPLGKTSFDKINSLLSDHES